MVTATPTTIGTVLQKLLDQAIREAGEQPGHLSDFFQQIGRDAGTIVDEVKKIPGEALDALRSPPFRPPDWWSLLVFLMVRIVDLIGDPHLSLGYRHPEGWSRMLTLTYAEDADDPDNTAAGTVGVAVTDPGVTHGIWLQVLKDFTFAKSVAGLQIQITANGNADWKYIFGAAMTPPGPVAHVEIDVRWTPWNPDLHPAGGAFGFDVGPIHLHLTLSSPGGPLYAVTLGLGVDGQPGVEASLDVERALGPALGSFVDISPLDESYSPQLILTQGASPQFSLGHRGIG
jgi:hypothetical protein